MGRQGTAAGVRATPRGPRRTRGRGGAALPGDVKPTSATWASCRRTGRWCCWTRAGPGSPPPRRTRRAAGRPGRRGSRRYRCDRQIEDVEALRVHLGLDRLDLAAHSAGAALALLYAARHPDRVARLALITPSPRPVGLDVADSDRRELAELRQGEPWFPDAFAAFARIWSGEAAAADWTAITPFTHSRWDAASQAHAAQGAHQRNTDAAVVYYSDGALDPAAVRSAAARLRAPVLFVAGGYDVGLPPKRAAEYAGLFPRAELAVQPGGGHYPWLDDPEWFVETVREFLR
ncbi:alpha/beta fold hydrolase [Micromonospora sp. NPDC048830]|uniref:alpha/beta fold hydrolase n=1 Tax=Micromonospora sp. NPDC048830 TaxID=3364257 RepID=UPI0037141547